MMRGIGTEYLIEASGCDADTTMAGMCVLPVDLAPVELHHGQLSGGVQSDGRLFDHLGYF